MDKRTCVQPTALCDQHIDEKRNDADVFVCLWVDVTRCVGMSWRPFLLFPHCIVNCHFFFFFRFPISTVFIRYFVNVYTHTPTVVFRCKKKKKKCRNSKNDSCQWFQRWLVVFLFLKFQFRLSENEWRITYLLLDTHAHIVIKTFLWQIQFHLSKEASHIQRDYITHIVKCPTNWPGLVRCYRFLSVPDAIRSFLPVL